MKKQIFGRCGAAVARRHDGGAMRPPPWRTPPRNRACHGDVGRLSGSGRLSIARATSRRTSAAASAAFPFSNQPTAHTSEFRFTARQSRLSHAGPRQCRFRHASGLLWRVRLSWRGRRSANSNESNSYSPRIRNCTAPSTGIRWAWRFWPARTGRWLTLNSHGITPRNEVSAGHDRRAICRGLQLGAPAADAHHQELGQPVLAGAVGGKSADHLCRRMPPAARASRRDRQHAGGSLNSTTINKFSLNHIPDVDRQGCLGADDRRLPATAHGSIRHLSRSSMTASMSPASNALGLPVGNSNNECLRRRLRRQHHLDAPFPKLLDLQATAMTGTGIGRYGSGQLPDVTFRPNGALAPIQETTLLVGATWHATPDAGPLRLCRPGSSKSPSISMSATAHHRPGQSCL